MIEFGHRRTGPPRWAGGFAAMALPFVSILTVFRAGFWETGGVQQLATGLLAEMMFLIVAPTTWIFAIEFIEVSRFTAIAIGALTSLPLWFLLGSFLADRSQDWRIWLTRYAIAYLGWIGINLTLFVVIGSIVA